MPTYNYKCPSCGEETELFLTISQMESSEITCSKEECGAVMKKMIGAPAPKTEPRHHHPVPKNYKPGSGGANFGLLKDL